MLPWIQNTWKSLTTKQSAESPVNEKADILTTATTVDVDIDPDDPLLPHLINASGVVEIDNLNLDSPTLKFLKDVDIKIVVPLVSQGELIGLLNLGPRRSEQDYSADDRRLLSNLATQAAPALRVAQLVRQQQIEARERERLEQELRVARVIQQTLLPKELPNLPGWQLAAHWQPARAVSGDFYDFIFFPDGRIAIVVADVTDKGVPAALVMASSRSTIRSVAEHLISPGAVLKRANNLLHPDIPPKMFITCLYVLLDPQTGQIKYANAGHNLPYQRTSHGVIELRARGMPLGLMPDMEYEEMETTLEQGDNVVLYSDGLIEAHSPEGEMFGFPRLRELLVLPQCGNELIHCMMDELVQFTGENWEQEDDVTFVTLERKGKDNPVASSKDITTEEILVAEFSLASEPGNEKAAMEKVAEAVQDYKFPTDRLEKLKTAVAEATLNAMEHGNKFQPELKADIRVLKSGNKLKVYITDQGSEIPIPEPETPNLEAKLEGLQSPRGWGLFLIEKMVDEMHIHSDEEHHTVELIFLLEGE